MKLKALLFATLFASIAISATAAPSHLGPKVLPKPAPIHPIPIDPPVHHIPVDNPRVNHGLGSVVIGPVYILPVHTPDILAEEEPLVY